jgi:hypothetical protein
MKNILLILVLNTILLSSCAQTKNQETFEGIITYKISVTTKTDNINYNEYQIQKYGDKLKVYITKDGSFKREFLTSGQKGFVFFTYNALTNTCYTKWRNIDTIYSSICSINSLSFKEEKDLTNETILGQSCKGYYISGIEPKSNQIVSLSYFYPTENQYINPTLYKNYNDFFYNKVMEKIQAPFYKLKMDMGKYIVNFEIEKIENEVINSDIIELPKNIPVKK